MLLDLPSKTVEITVEDSSGEKREYIITFPKTGQLMQIQAMKVSLLRGQLGSILDAGTSDANYVNVLADMTASFTVLCPKLIDDLPVDAISDLDAIDSARLTKVYLDQYLPWYTEWKTILMNGGVRPKKKEEEFPDKKENQEEKKEKNTKPKITLEK